MKLFGKNPDTDLIVVAEIGVNHEGDPEKAKELLRHAAKAGATAVKFQSYTPEKYVSSIDPERLARVRRFALDEDTHRQLAALARELGVSFLSTPVSHDWLPLLDELGDAIKIASGDVNFEPVIRGAAKTEKPVIMSVGLGTEQEIERAIGWFQDEIGDADIRERLILLHCVSAYPVPVEEANVANVHFLRDRFGLRTGYSNHVIGPDACLAAAATGANIFEVHFTDQSEGRTFRDHALSMDGAKFRSMIEQMHRIRAALGKAGQFRQPSESENLSAMRKGIVAGRDLAAGTVISEDDIDFARPVMGFTCDDTVSVIGKTLTEDLAAGLPFSPDRITS